MRDEAEEVRKQALVGAYNRRVARELENGNRAYALAGLPELRLGEFMCTCGRPGCDEVLVLALEQYRFVQEQPYRFVVASGHATEVDQVVEATGEYDVVEIVERYRSLLEG